uniref:Uncharacterized protein n=1 Tax=Dulem virus 50 TaxID=3145761 RepID=A0AAU8B2J1_9VIRU
MLIFYTVNPEPEINAKAFIVRIFKEQDSHPRCLKTVCFPVTDPSRLQKARNQACKFGRLSVKELMDKELRNEGFRD